MKIAFLSNKLTLRGTEVAMYDYADYNEILLQNKSIIITRDINKYRWEKDISDEAYEKFNKRFDVYYYDTINAIEEIITRENVDLLYIIKSGQNDGLITNKCKTLIHCVFNTSQPHGNLYVPISKYVNKSCGTNYPVLPHMIRLYETTETLHKYLNLPPDAIIFGIMGGKECFSIDYIQKAVIDTASKKENNIFFISLNIEFSCPKDTNIIFIPGTADMKFKRNFINTCDALIYGREHGESFGLCIGEFSLCDKPIIARDKKHDGYNGGFDTFHIDTLGDNLIAHNNYDELMDILNNWNKYNKDVSKNKYKEYTPKKVMDIFKELII